MSEPDATMTRIGQGMELSRRGERAAARELFAEVWDECGGQAGDPLHRCALAHAMADVQDDVQQELAWDLRALDAADLVTDERAAQAGVTSPVAGFFPSLHLNVAECYRKLGDLECAREHLRRGTAAVGALSDDGYGQMIKSGLGWLAERLASASRAEPSWDRRDCRRYLPTPAVASPKQPARRAATCSAPSRSSNPSHDL